MKESHWIRVRKELNLHKRSQEGKSSTILEQWREEFVGEYGTTPERRGNPSSGRRL